MPEVATTLSTPRSLKAEHEELHHELAAATRLPGRLGELARTVAVVLEPHFVKEEEFALPPLSALGDLALGKIPDRLEKVRAMAGRLEMELGGMAEEHRAIVSALERFAEVAREEGRVDLVRFVEKLKHHAALEEEVLYPAAVLVGKYLELIFAREMPTGNRTPRADMDVQC